MTLNPGLAVKMDMQFMLRKMARRWEEEAVNYVVDTGADSPEFSMLRQCAEQLYALAASLDG